MGLVKITNRFLSFADYKHFSDVFIETGTHAGQGVWAALNAGFSDIRSVEYDADFFRRSSKRFDGDNRVKLFFGKSVDKLPEMLEGVSDPAVFWLDAHPSGAGTGGHDDLMKNGEMSEFAQDNVLTKELQIILTHGGNHVILIDDQFGESEANQKYMNTILDANPNYRFEFYDQQVQENFYKDKILACIPL